MINKRSKERYRLPLPVEYETRDGDRGTGIVVDISSRAARIALDRPHPIRTEMRLDIAWPVRQDNSTPLHLRITSRIERIDQLEAVLMFRAYEFVTSGAVGSQLTSTAR
jgi:hypothetical protein